MKPILYILINEVITHVRVQKSYTLFASGRVQANEHMPEWSIDKFGFINSMIPYEFHDLWEKFSKIFFKIMVFIKKIVDGIFHAGGVHCAP